MQIEITISDWITIIFGLMGLLGTAYTIWSKWDSKREKIEINKSFGFLTYDSHLSEEYYLFLECTNHSERMVTLASCYLELPDKKIFPDISKIYSVYTSHSNSTQAKVLNMLLIQKF